MLCLTTKQHNSMYVFHSMSFFWYWLVFYKILSGGTCRLDKLSARQVFSIVRRFVNVVWRKYMKTGMIIRKWRERSEMV
jgi:hypothetical protein